MFIRTSSLLAVFALVLLTTACVSAPINPAFERHLPIKHPVTADLSQPTTTYPGDLQAAYAAFQTAADIKGPCYQYSGIIAQTPAGAYVYSYPVTQYRTDHNKMYVNNPLGLKRIGVYHTECGGDGEFTPEVVQQALTTHTKAYAANGRHMRVFDPSNRHASPVFYSDDGPISYGSDLMKDLQRQEGTLASRR